jgi:hypothetical protein
MLWPPAIGRAVACSADTPARDSSSEGPCQAPPSSARLSCSSRRFGSPLIAPTHPVVVASLDLPQESLRKLPADGVDQTGRDRSEVG